MARGTTMPVVCVGRVKRRVSTMRREREQRRADRNGSAWEDRPSEMDGERDRSGVPRAGHVGEGMGHGYASCGGTRKRKRERARSKLWSPVKGRGRGGVHGRGEAGYIDRGGTEWTPTAADNAVAWGSKRRRD